MSLNYDAEKHRGSISVDKIPTLSRNSPRNHRRGSYKPPIAGRGQAGELANEVCPIAELIRNILELLLQY